MPSRVRSEMDRACERNGVLSSVRIPEHSGPFRSLIPGRTDYRFRSKPDSAASLRLGDRHHTGTGDRNHWNAHPGPQISTREWLHIAEHGWFHQGGPRHDRKVETASPAEAPNQLSFRPRSRLHRGANHARDPRHARGFRAFAPHAQRRGFPAREPPRTGGSRLRRGPSGATFCAPPAAMIGHGPASSKACVR